MSTVVILESVSEIYRGIRQELEELIADLRPEDFNFQVSSEELADLLRAIIIKTDVRSCTDHSIMIYWPPALDELRRQNLPQRLVSRLSELKQRSYDIECEQMRTITIIETKRLAP